MNISYTQDPKTPIADCVGEIGARALQDLDQKKNDGKPLVVLIGENHDQTPHIAVQMGALKFLQDQGLKIAYGMEHTHNELTAAIRWYFMVNYKEKPPLFAPQDPPNALSLKIKLAFWMNVVAPVSNQVIQCWLLQNPGISVRFNDVANTNHDLDYSDPLTGKLMDKHNLKTCSTSTAKGLKLRNEFITDRTLEHIQETRPDIYVLNCGNAHLAGQKNHFSYKDSLHALFNSAGYQTLCIPLKTDIYNLTLPKNHALTPKNSLLNIKTPHARAWNFWEMSEEIRYLRKTLPLAGIDAGLLDKLQDIKEQNLKEITALFESSRPLAGFRLSPA